MNKIFIDVGANRGQSIEQFLDHWEGAADFKIYSFECSPKLKNVLTKTAEKNKSRCKSIRVITKAAWDKNGKQTFYDEGNESSSLLSEKTTVNPITVDVIDLSQWIQTKFEPEDYIVLKIDAEGAEYNIFNKFAKDNTFVYIDKLYGELHSRKCGKGYKDDIKIIKNIEEENLKLHFWDASNNLKIRSDYYTPEWLEATYKRKGWKK